MNYNYKTIDMTRRFKRLKCGAIAGVVLCTAVISPLAFAASESELAENEFLLEAMATASPDTSVRTNPR